MNTSQCVLRVKSRQSGIATVAIAFLLVLMMGVAVLGASTLSSGVSRDAASEHARVRAIFLAETGMERASYRFNNGTACRSIGETVTVTGVGTAVISGFTTDFSGTNLNSTVCRIRVAATTTGASTADQATRTIESVVQQTTLSSRGNRTFSCDISSGANLGLIVSVTWTTNISDDFNLTGVVFNGFQMTQQGATASNTGGGGRYKAANFYLGSVTAGTGITGTLSFSGDPKGVTYGCLQFAGVTAPGGTCTSPIEATSIGAATNNAPTIVLATTSCTGNRYFVDVVARDNSGNLSMVGTTCGGSTTRTPAWTFNSNNDTGTGSYCGLVGASSGNVNYAWSWNQSNKAWADAGLVIFATGIGKVSGGKPSSISFTSGASTWREITVPPS